MVFERLVWCNNQRMIIDLYFHINRLFIYSTSGLVLQRLEVRCINNLHEVKARIVLTVAYKKNLIPNQLAKHQPFTTFATHRQLCGSVNRGTTRRRVFYRVNGTRVFPSTTPTFPVAVLGVTSSFCCIMACMHVTERELPAAHVHRGGKPREDNWKRGHVRGQDGAE